MIGTEAVVIGCRVRVRIMPVPLTPAPVSL